MTSTEDADKPKIIRIGFLEDDQEQAEFIRVLLEDSGYQVTHSLNGTDFIRSVQNDAYDMLLLDWDVPNLSGVEVLAWVRRNLKWDIPVVFLTSMDAEENVVEALKAGADDYVIKPMQPSVFLARIEALARRSGLNKPHSRVISLGEYELNLDTRECVRNDDLVALTKKEFELAGFLFENVNKILSRDFLLKHVWNMGNPVHTRTVDTHISRIRSKLGLVPENGWRLSSVYHYGYRLERLE